MTKEGEERNAEIHIVPHRGESGEFSGALGFARDITERKEREEKLRRSEERYRRLFESAKVAIIVHGSEGEILSANPAAERAFGLTEEQLKEKDLDFWKGKLYRENGEPMEVHEFPVSKILDSKEPDEGTVIGISMSENGDIRWYIHGGVPQLSEEGEIEKVITSFKDITDQKKAEERFEKLFEANPDPTFFIDEKGVFREVNEVAVEVLGYEKEEIKGESLPEVPFFPSETKEKIIENFKKRLRGAEIPPYMIEAESENGENLYGEVNSALLEEKGEPVGVIGVVRDVTERKKAEENLQEYKSAVEASDDSIYMVDEDYRYVFANDEHVTRLMDAGRIEEGDKDRIIGLEYKDIHPQEEWEAFRKNAEKVIETEDSLTETFASLALDRWSERTYSLVKDPRTNEVKGVVVVSKDITKQKEALREAKTVRALLDAFPAHVYYKDEEGRYVYSNESSSSAKRISFNGPG
ncbi:hypothetical protein AKJ41_04080 [candidate division MSBL1 archaeon SCGC-AAA259O05]|uniref:histidine kinase n=2 Tax=candidate division MSBL1 TaxID=215777 RepID=A0A133V1T0_9EURY|nr:hypothetical protein AKJ41_04080 [candidate division MSBL1 archaeon SCGC-AAA259O05]